MGQKAASDAASYIKKLLEEKVNTSCPATILRKHKNILMYVDTDAASLL